MTAGRRPDLLDADAAVALLGVEKATLYAYVSRGLVRRAPGPDGRRRLYHRSDLEQLRARHDARAGHGPAAAGALRFGEPVLESAVTLIDPERGPLYRGVAAVELAARGHTAEAVADHLWATPHDPAAWARAADAAARAAPRLRAHLGRGGHVHTRMAALLARAALQDDDRHDAPRDRELERARRVMHLLVCALEARVAPHTAAGAPRRAAYRHRSPAPTRAAALTRAARRSDAAPARAPRRSDAAPTLSARILAALGAPSAGRDRLRAVDAALVLIADHELNASSFAARIAASTGADLFMCLLAAIATVSGPEHGSSPDRVEALLEEIGRPARAAAVVRARAARGDGVPGFGHRLYIGGDPRTPPLLALAEALSPRAPHVRTARALIDAMADAGHSPPSVDVGLVAVSAALGLPPGTASALFALGRAAGWTAHALEQRQQGFMLRPRAHYVGPAPSPSVEP